MEYGPCDRCEECNLSGPCKHGLEVRPSMEACGIDVFKTARDNGFPLKVLRTRDEERILDLHKGVTPTAKEQPLPAVLS